jgi:trimeric autotransporter adhesin
MKTPIPLLLTVLAFFSLAATVPKVQAVVPAPDGGYPGGNTAEGQSALLSLTSGGFNTALGFLSLRSDATSSFNTAIGAGTLLANTADQNTATGAAALFSNTTAGFNTADGAFALFSNTTGASNNAMGDHALFQNTGGSLNVAVGSSALINNTTGTGNIALGFFGGVNVTTASSVICIGTGGADVNNSCFIGNIFNQTSASGVAVFVNQNGRLGTMTSSRRFKDEIKPMEQASEALYALKPVSFRYKKQIDPAGTSQLGLVAEDVEKVNPDLIVRDKEGKPCSVRYDQVNAMLLNEFLKEHRKVEKLEATVADLAATVKEQAAQLRTVAAHVQMNNSAGQVAVNNR